MLAALLLMLNVVSMIGTIVFKGAECTSWNVKRL